MRWFVLWPSARQEPLKVIDNDRQEVGIDVLEMDVVFTKDGIPVVWHDVSSCPQQLFRRKMLNAYSMKSQLRNAVVTMSALSLRI